MACGWYNGRKILDITIKASAKAKKATAEKKA
jgi:hypothetical protein